MNKSIQDYYSKKQIEWLITHERTMRRIIDASTPYCTLIRSNILKQHDVYNAENIARRDYGERDRNHWNYHKIYKEFYI